MCGRYVGLSAGPRRRWGGFVAGLAAWRGRQVFAVHGAVVLAPEPAPAGLSRATRRDPTTTTAAAASATTHPDATAGAAGAVATGLLALT